VGKKKGAKPKLTRKRTFVQGKTHLDMTNLEVMPRTANVVHRVKLNEDAPPIDGSPDVFFKAHDDAQAPSQYAVASTRLARALDMRSVISHNAFARVNGTSGIVSGSVPGVQLVTNRIEQEEHAPSPASKKEIASWAKQRQLEERGGKFYSKSGETYQWIDFRDPKIQKGMSDLQLFDAITGQNDRHGGNVFVDPASGRVTGIDDDKSFGSGMAVDEQALPYGFKYVGLPELVDEETAEKVLAVNPDDLREELAAAQDDTETLTVKEIDDAVRRLENVQQHLRLLKSTDQLVRNWDDATYQRSYDDPEGSYVGRSARDLERAITLSARGTDFMVANAPPPPPPAGMPGLPPPPPPILQNVPPIPQNLPPQRPRGTVAPPMVIVPQPVPNVPQPVPIVPAAATNAAIARQQTQWIRVVPRT